MQDHEYTPLLLPMGTGTLSSHHVSTVTTTATYLFQYTPADVQQDVQGEARTGSSVAKGSRNGASASKSKGASRRKRRAREDRSRQCCRQQSQQSQKSQQQVAYEVHVRYLQLQTLTMTHFPPFLSGTSLLTTPLFRNAEIVQSQSQRPSW